MTGRMRKRDERKVVRGAGRRREEEVGEREGRAGGSGSSGLVGQGNMGTEGIGPGD
jgi:hypothetical protein